MNFGEYSINALKQFDTPDGGGYNLNILRKGKKVADAHEAGHGGEVVIGWFDHAKPKIEHHTTNWEGKPHSYYVTPEEKLFLDFLDTLPREKSEYFEDGMKVCGGIFLDEMINTLNAKKEAKKILRKSFIFHRKDFEAKVYVPYPRKFKGREVPESMALKAAERDYPGATLINSYEEMVEVGIL